MTEALRLCPLTLWQPKGLCLFDLTCSNWLNDHLTLSFSDLYSREPFFPERNMLGPEFVQFIKELCIVLKACLKH